MSTRRGLHATGRTVPGLLFGSLRVTRRRTLLCGHRGLSTGQPLQNDFFKDLESQFKAFRQKASDALPGRVWTPLANRPALPPERADVVIVGGGAVGWSIAYWLKKKERIRDGVRILVVEKDPTYSQASTVLSAGGIRQQFSLPENVLLSLASADFMRNIDEHLSVLNEGAVDLHWNHSGYLILANENAAPVMEKNRKTQRDAGAKVSLLSPVQLKDTFPWINTDGVALASYGLENEGWFDPWALLNAFRRKAMSMGGVQQCIGEVTGFSCRTSIMDTVDGDCVDFKRITHVKVQMPNGLEYQLVRCAVVVNAAGAFSGKLAQMLGIGLGPRSTMAGIPVPVEPRTRYIYVLHCPNGPGLDTPFLIDYSGVYCRREGLGGNYIAGTSPEEVEPDAGNLEVDHQFFEENIRPHLAHRVPAFENLTVTGAWAGFYDYNTFDQNAIVGVHPMVNNMYFATGFSGHGLQHSPAVGRAVAELILEGSFKTLDLSGLGFRRILEQEPMLEMSF